MKTVLFIPGFGEEIHDRDYNSVLKAFKANGFKTKFIPINWARTNLTHWLHEFNKIYQNYEPNQTILVGFSFGAVTAFVAAAERNPSALILCSLSPYFSGDNPKEAWLKYIGKRRAIAFADVDFPRLASMIKCRTLILHGSDESKGIAYRVHEAHRLIKNSELISVPGTKHDIAAPAYIHAIASLKI